MNNTKSSIYERLIYEPLMKLSGNRKTSLLSSYKPMSVKLSNVKFTKFYIKKENFNLSGNSEYIQGKLPSCACTTIGAQSNDSYTFSTHNKTLSVNWRNMWEDLIRMGKASKNGSYLIDNIWYAKTLGIKTNRKERMYIKNVQRVSHKNIEKFLRNGFQIYTGSFVGYRMCDKYFNFIPNKKTGGHAFRIIGIEDGKFLCETTWSNYGIRRESHFYLKKEDVSSLFGCYAMDFEIK